MKHTVLAFVLAAIVASPAYANEIDQLASNLKASCSNHFRQPPNKPSSDSKKFCRCFADTFTSTISLRELDAANGVLTPEIQEEFDRASEICSQNVSSAVAHAGRTWISETN